MNYSKPEIAILGSAALAIQGGSQKQQDPGFNPVIPLTNSADCELDD
jgi:hypothetical protein